MHTGEYCAGPRRRLPLSVLLNLRISGYAAGRVAYVFAAGSLLPCSKIFEYGFDVVAKFRRVFIPDSADFGDNWVNLKFLHFFEYPVATTRRPGLPGHVTR